MAGVVWDRLRASYDKAADKYTSRFLDELSGKPRDRELLESFAHAVGDPVADVGCGPGQIGWFVKERGRRVIGIDFSFGMALLAADRLDASVVADLRSLPFGSGRLGGNSAFYSLIHVPRDELPVALGELRRVLRPGGRALFSAHEGQGQIEHDDFLEEGVPFVATLFELDELVDATIAVGLEVLGAKRRAPYPSESETTRLYVEALRPGDSPRGPGPGATTGERMWA